MSRALLILLLLPGVAWADFPMTYLRAAGPAADRLANLGWGLIGVSLAVTLFITLAVLIGILRNRAKGPHESLAGPPVSRGGNGLPWIYLGVGVSAVLLLASAVWSFYVMAATAAPSGDPKITLDVTGHQWWWEVRYRREGESKRTFVTANEIHIPVGEPVRVRLISSNVIHSFWVPQLAGKTDVIPGQTNIAWIKADRAGVYRGQCTEFCGLQHAHMALHVVAQPSGEFKAWWDHQLEDAKLPATATPAAQRGQQVFQARCAICHTVHGLGGENIIAQGKIGPDLTHLMSRRMIAAGTLPNNTGYLAAWVQNAQALKPGVDMPTLALTNRQLLDVVSYLETLR